MQVICTVKYKVFAIKQRGQPGRWRVRILKNEAKIGTQGVIFIVFPSLADLVGPVEEKNFPN